MKEKKIYMIGNAHLDPVWLWQWQEGFHEVKATFRSALDRMSESEDFVFVSSSAAYYEWVEQSDPAMFAEIKQRVAEGRWRLVGGWWIQPDCNIPSGESFVRQALYGQRYFKEKFGRTAKVGYNVDSFGHNGMLPQLLKKSGLDYYIFMRPMPHEKGLPGRLFWWESADGSRVLTFRIPFEYCTWGKDLEAHVQRVAGEIKQPFDASMCFYGVGNHGGGPTIENIESIRRMEQGSDFPHLIFASPEDYFMDMQARGLSFPVVRDELQHHAVGCYSAHSGIKRWNRRAESALAAAEKWSSIAAWTTGTLYPKDLSRAWKGLLFNQFHDILAGTSIEPAYEDARDQLGETISIASRAFNAAAQSFAWNIKIQPEDNMTPIVVFNPHAWAAKAPVEMEFRELKEGEILLDDHGMIIPVQTIRSEATAKGRHRIAFTADLPSLGYSTYRLVKAEKHPKATAALEKMLRAGDAWIENDDLRIELDPHKGTLRSIFDKRHGLEILSDDGALPTVIDDRSDTWSHNVFHYKQVIGCFEASSVCLAEYGPVKATIRVTSRYGSSRLVQELSLYRELAHVEVRAWVNWQEQFKMLKLRFPLNLSHMNASAEIPYGSILRAADGQEEPCQSWVDVSGLSRDTGAPYGFSLLNDGKYSFDVNVRDLGMTILRSPIYAHHLPIEPDMGSEYNFIDQGLQKFCYTILPHQGSWETAGTVQRAAELNQPAYGMVATYHPKGKLPQSGSFASVSRENILLTVLKQAEEGEDLVLRAVEVGGEATHATILLPKWNLAVDADFGPNEIKTFRMSRGRGKQVVETDLLEWELE